MLRLSLSLVLVAILISSVGCMMGGQYPGYVLCKGAGTIEGSGIAPFRLTVSCPDGLEFQQGKEGPKYVIPNK